MNIFMNHSAAGYLILATLTWFITFIILGAGVFFRRRILSRDEKWKDAMESQGTPLEHYVEDMKASYKKIQSTSRILGGLLFIFLILMGFLLYVGFVHPNILGMRQVMSGLWLLTLLIVAVILPAYVSFAVGRNLSETMLLKANFFIHRNEIQIIKEKRLKQKMTEKAKEIQALRDKNKTAAVPAAAGTPQK
jgi:thiosulfate reductase cytochrome b subunit